ncbi:MAG: phosphoglycolate phosphatase [Ketobacteraceae bacterium]|nr:phosphoglycolate phosphatase [Ketobacteraceae bacterium]
MLLNRLLGPEPGLVAFDLDGTLVNSVPDIATAVDKMLVALGREPAGEQAVAHWVGNGAENLVRRALAGGHGDALEASVSDAEFATAFPVFRKHYQACNGRLTRLYDGVRECLEVLQALGVPQAVVTNKPKLFADPLLAALGIDRFFDRVIGGDCFPEKKPSPMALDHLARDLSVKPGHSLMVGDSKHDVGAGRAAGYRVLCVSYGYNHGEPIADSRPDAIVDSLAELVA